MKSGQQLAQDNLAKFVSWIAERETADEVQLCPIRVSAVPANKSALEALEVLLLTSAYHQLTSSAE